MKTVFSNSNQVIHVWANQTQDGGRCSNVFFNKDVIYSYGYHFCMGKVLPDKRVIITDRSYSVTTAKHLSEVRYGTNHLDKLYAPYPNGNFADNMKVWQSRIKTNIETINNSRKRANTKEAAKGELLNIVSNIEKFTLWTGLKPYSHNKEELKEFKLYFEAAKNEQAGKELSEKLAKRAQLARKKELKARKEQLKLQNEYLAKWLSGANIQYQFFNLIDGVYLRAIGDNLQTSKGAEVSLKAAKILFKMIQAGKDIKGFEIDGFTVIGLNGVLTIGCHKIERSEINRFAVSQNWGTIELH